MKPVFGRFKPRLKFFKFGHRTFYLSILDFEIKFFLQFLVDILPLGSGDTRIFEDNPGSKNLADPTDPDPKHCKHVCFAMCGLLSELE